MKKFLLATVSMVALASVGRAADLPAAMPAKAPMYMPAPVADWTGVYLGIQGGVASQHAFFDDTDCFVTNNCRHFDRQKTGGTAGALAGYNWQQGNFVYGVEGDWSWIGARANQLAIVDTNTSVSTSFDVNCLATLRGRAGLAFDATLAYVTGGLALGHVKNNVDAIFAGSGQVASFSQNRTKVGWTAGVGVEHMFSRHWTARAEFRYVDLGKTTVSCRDNLGSCVSYRGDFSNTLKLGLVGLAYKF